MTKSIATILIASVFSLQAYSQQVENKLTDKKDPLRYTVNKSKYFSFLEYTKLPPSLYELQNPKLALEETSSYNSDLNQFLDKNMELIYNRPKKLIEKGIIRDQLLNVDFNKTQLNRLSTNFYLFHHSQKKTYNSLGAYTQFNKAIRFQPNSRFSADFGGYFSRQFDYLSGSYGDIWGATTQVRFNLTNMIQLKFWGEYVMKSGNNKLYFGYPLFPGSNFGSSLLIKFNEQTGAEFGVRYQYYEFKKSWSLESFGKLYFDF